jgi:hypothetical protein
VTFALQRVVLPTLSNNGPFDRIHTFSNNKNVLFGSDSRFKGVKQHERKRYEHGYPFESARYRRHPTILFSGRGRLASNLRWNTHLENHAIPRSAATGCYAPTISRGASASGCSRQ